MNDKISELKNLAEASSRIVFFGGAGVSTESGIPDFRGAAGLYRGKHRIPPETVLSHTFFRHYPEEFYEFYRAHMEYPDAQPNAAHRKLAEWERDGRLLAVVTQNIDGLHQAAGSEKVLELHGTIHKNHCMRCGAFHSLSQVMAQEGAARCDCGGLIKPDVVLYEESLDTQTLSDAVGAIHDADLLIVGGTSLSVYPAAGLIEYYRGKRLVLINKTETAYDDQADLIIREPIGEVFSQL